MIPENIRQWVPQVNEVCMKVGISQSLVLAVITKESNGNPNAKRKEPRYRREYVDINPKWLTYSRKNNVSLEDIATSYGLMQMMFTTACGYGCKSIVQALDPYESIRFGAAHLKMLLNKYDDMGEALAAYNGGNGGAAAWRAKKNTDAVVYAKDVMRIYEEYKKDMQSQKQSTANGPSQTNFFKQSQKQSTANGPSQTNFFKKSELTCKCGCGLYNTTDALLSTLNSIRSAIGAPVIVISGTRCKKHNAAQKGSVPNSGHVTGEAADIAVDGVGSLSLINTIEKIYKDGLIPFLQYAYRVSASSVHVGVDKKKRSRMFDKS